jgi:uncharacterized RDD family membrane protein YckC
MTQPPDDLERRPGDAGPGESGTGDAASGDVGREAPEDQPTVAWTPPEPPAVPAGDVPTGEEPAGEVPLTEWTPTQPAPLEVPAPTPPDAGPPPAGDAPLLAPPSPIISASPAVPSDVAQQPAAGAPLVGWETPAPAGAAPGREGYVIAGMGARLVAYFIDSVLVSIVPTILTLLVIDYQGMIRQAIEAQGTGAPGQTSFVMAVTPQLILVTFISVAIQYMYFVGFWTSGSRATPGMRGLRMQVVDAATGGTQSLTAATKRFIALGFPLALLILVPALQSAAGVVQFAVSLFLFFTAITNDRRQGLHDKWANSLVIRSVTSGDGATLVGCLLLIVIVVGFGIIVAAAGLAALGPQLEELMREMENTV